LKATVQKVNSNQVVNANATNQDVATPTLKTSVSAADLGYTGFFALNESNATEDELKLELFNSELNKETEFKNLFN
jgi:hypothetical protein